MAQQKTTVSSNKNEEGIILRRPVISEKANRLSETGTYTFFVSERSNKITIGRAVSSRFGVEVLNVRVLGTPYKKVRRGRSIGRKGGYKKACITIRSDQKIELT
ncbi:MAG: 50S ribosomal protein L23 [Candidatus Ryanbacteria bacterium RIFCSPHIGHO2_02_FULL_45_13b]|uniref:Large ribosomal subunit protein uL23 n=1 Tax=Candidatus Ryanbacteria bacterium RIFCSPHIGHO2_02_FULL_45_13b TaxID=1802117 RepID=A0A1G2G6V4_9BACT|nr:MAG: 50S ribosomal protein L23 [Candidatus Ryanbacteria bacterium RIFCSPHIGHO2_02_FULL_45_13b]